MSKNLLLDIQAYIADPVARRNVLNQRVGFTGNGFQHELLKLGTAMATAQAVSVLPTNVVTVIAATDPVEVTFGLASGPVVVSLTGLTVLSWPITSLGLRNISTTKSVDVVILQQ